MIHYDPHFHPTTESLSDDQRLDLGKHLLDNYISKPGGFEKLHATSWLMNLGFEVEWLQQQDDILLLMLWRYTPDDQHRTLDEFILEFTGHDAAIVSLFCLTKSVEL